jgi:aminopeptidase N
MQLLKIYSLLLVSFVCFHKEIFAQLGDKKNMYTIADTLRGSNGKWRQNWDVLKYDITVEPDIVAKTINGKCDMYFVDNGATKMQIDLQEPMILDSVKQGTTSFNFTREKNVYWLIYRNIKGEEKFSFRKSNQHLIFYFHGKPREAKRAPWDGGWVWKKDKNNNPWVTVACQGLGASVWYPCKDIQSDKPEKGASLSIIIPDSLVAVGNGRLKEKINMAKAKIMYTWVVKNPINNYCIIPYIGKYVNFSEKYKGLKGNLDMDYWVLDYNLEKAKKQFLDAPKMMKAFEHWFGPYPFYEDSYKLVDAPHLGMEHQSATAYGNEYKNGYLGKDWSGTGEGMKWDFIIIHESGHEWFANSICSKDIADMWIHEGFTDYSETLFVDYFWGKEAGNSYVQGIRTSIDNDIPIIGPYGVNKEGSGDMYFKGGNMIHIIRQIANDDNKFRALLNGLNKDFYHKTVTTQEIERYISKKLKFDFSSIFDQYLRTIKVPLLEYKIEGKIVSFRYTNVVNKFIMPIRVKYGLPNETDNWLVCNTEWNSTSLPDSYDGKTFLIDKDFYINSKNVGIQEISK